MTKRDEGLELYNQGITWKEIGKALYPYEKDELKAGERARSLVRKHPKYVSKARDANIESNTTMFRKRILLKPEIIVDEDFLKKGLASLESNYKHLKVKPIKKDKANYMYEFAPVDIHFGKLAWAPEVGEDYDIDIAEEKLLSAVESTLSTIPAKEVEQIIFPGIGNDFFHFDNDTQSTTAGTLQDSDTRWQLMYSKGTELLAKVIGMLSEVAPVTALHIPGNHDYILSYCCAGHLAAFFKNHPNVTIDAGPSVRKYRQYGETGVGWTHGDWDNKNLQTLFPIEAKEIWSTTKFHEMHAAHRHAEHTNRKNLKLIEDDCGVIVRHNCSFVGSDAWHVKNGFVGNTQRSQSYLYDKSEGLVQTFYHY